MRHEPDAESVIRKKLLRRATVYTAAFLGAGVAIAVLGAALIAWLLTYTGQPFRRTWLVVTLIIVLPGMLAALWKLVRGR
ncbi:hypothetical protein BH23GEM9_BH23GEM9_09890 [soil metagenome]